MSHIHQKMCKGGKNCTNKSSCILHHTCAYGDNCYVKECVYIHPGGDKRAGIVTGNICPFGEKMS